MLVGGGFVLRLSGDRSICTGTEDAKMLTGSGLTPSLDCEKILGGTLLVLVVVLGAKILLTTLTFLSGVDSLEIQLIPFFLELNVQLTNLESPSSSKRSSILVSNSLNMSSCTR